MGFIMDGLDAEGYDRQYDDRALVRRVATYFWPDRKVMVITSRRPWSDTAAADDRVAVYDISEHTASYIRGHLRDETRTTASGKDVV